MIFNGGGDNDTVITGDEAGGGGSTRNLEAVRSLTFNGGGGTDSMTIQDGNNPYSHALSRQYTVTSSGVDRFSGLPNWPGVPIGVGVDFSSIENLTLTTGAEGDLVFVDNAPFGVTLNTGGGNDTVISGGGTGNLEAVNGLTFNGGSGADSVAINDSNNPYSHGLSGQYTVSSSGVDRYAAHPIVPGAPIGIGIDLNNVEDLTLNTGQQNDYVYIDNAPMGVTLSTGGGNDSVITGGSTGDLEAVNGLTFNGGGGVDSVSLNDENNPYSHGLSRHHTVTSTKLSRCTA